MSDWTRGNCPVCYKRDRWTFDLKRGECARCGAWFTDTGESMPRPLSATPKGSKELLFKRYD